MRRCISPLINCGHLNIHETSSCSSLFSLRRRLLSCFCFGCIHLHPPRSIPTNIYLFLYHSYFSLFVGVGHWKGVSRLQSADLPALASGSHPASAAPTIHPPPPLLAALSPLLLLFLFWFNFGFSSWLHFAPKCLSALEHTNISHFLFSLHFLLFNMSLFDSLPNIPFTHKLEFTNSSNLPKYELLSQQIE